MTGKLHEINVPMAHRDSCVLPGNSEENHRGTWFYDPRLLSGLEVGDEISFLCCGGEIAHGRITEVDLKPTTFPKFCSAINSSGFHWETVDQDVDEIGGVA